MGGALGGCASGGQWPIQPRCRGEDDWGNRLESRLCRRSSVVLSFCILGGVSPSAPPAGRRCWKSASFAGREPLGEK